MDARNKGNRCSDRCESASSRALRVAFVVYRFHTGGLERCVAHLCNRLDRGRFRPVVVCLERSGSAADWIARDDVEIIELHKKPRNDLGVVRRLGRVLKDKRIDVVHSHNWGTLLETALARRLAKVPVHVHAERGTLLGDFAGRGVRYRLRVKAMRWALQRSDAVVTNAESTRERIRALAGLQDVPIEVIPNGVAPPTVEDAEQARQRIREELGIPAEAFVAGSVGRLVPVKNYGLAVEALCRPPLRDRNVHLLLLGEGPEHDRLRTDAEQRGLGSRVHLPGRQEDVGNWLAAMDVYLNTSLSEGMSQSVVEAMAVGLPLVVTDVGDHRSLVNGEVPCGHVVPSGDAGVLAESIAECLTDFDERRRFGASARQRFVERHGIEQMVSGYQDFYERLAGKSPVQPATVGEGVPA